MTSRDPVHRIRLREDLGARRLQLTAKSYSARSGDHRSGGQRLNPPGELVRGGDERGPELLSRRPIEGGERLPAPGVEDRERRATLGPLVFLRAKTYAKSPLFI